jgi:hypothetical protein
MGLIFTFFLTSSLFASDHSLEMALNRFFGEELMGHWISILEKEYPDKNIFNVYKRRSLGRGGPLWCDQ